MAKASPSFPAFPEIGGVAIGVASGEIRYRDRDDIVLFRLAPESTTAVVWTQNRFQAAPIHVGKAHFQLSRSKVQFWLINAGNANALTGPEGIWVARSTSALLSALTQTSPFQVLPFSTGVIGEPLPIAPFIRALPNAVADLKSAPEQWERAARAIMTTDTFPKGAVAECEVLRRRVWVAGIAKGAGMIAPRLATMLAFIVTDAAVEQGALAKALNGVVSETFKNITVDGDTSTNDAVALAATGQAGNTLLTQDHPDYPVFCRALQKVCSSLAEQIVRDGEGATKLLRIVVEHAPSREVARQVALAIANSPLVKTAFFASDPNWGRILAAAGKSGVWFDPNRVRLWLDEVEVVRFGHRAPDYTEEQGRAVMARSEITVRLDLAAGKAWAEVLTCDLSYDYVRINAEYRT